MTDLTKLPDRLASRRLLLRRARYSDIPAIIRIADDWDVVKMTGSMPWPYPPRAARVFVEKSSTPSPRGTTYLLTAGRDVIGVVGLGVSPRMPGPEIGYFIGKPYWRRGYASEAARTIVTAAFADDDMDTVFCGYMLENRASGRVLRRLGFQETRTVRRWCRARMQTMPCREGVLTRSRWEARHA